MLDDGGDGYKGHVICTGNGQLFLEADPEVCYTGADRLFGKYLTGLNNFDHQTRICEVALILRNKYSSVIGVGHPV